MCCKATLDVGTQLWQGAPSTPPFLPPRPVEGRAGPGQTKYSWSEASFPQAQARADSPPLLLTQSSVKVTFTLRYFFVSFGRGTGVLPLG